MQEQNKPKDTGFKKNLMRVVAVTLIVAAVLGIFLFKNAGDQVPVATTSAGTSGGAPAPAATEEEGGLPLVITAVDLDSILAHGLPVMLDFGGEDCPPCQAMAPDLKQMHGEAQGAAVIHYTDVWENTEAAQGFPIRVVPTQVFILADGTPYQPSESFEEEIGAAFTSYTHKDTGELMFTVHEGALTLVQMRAILTDMGAAL